MALARFREERINKLEALKNAGIDPYGHRVAITGLIEEVRRMCPEVANPGDVPVVVTVAGRVMSSRDMGKSKWLDIKDSTGKIQVNLLQKTLGDKFKLCKNLDIGDFISVTGCLQKSRVGEITVFANDMDFLSKSLEPLPAKFKGLRDVEIRYRRRYLDLIANDEARERFVLRSKIISFIRNFLEQKKFLEVETPMLQAIYGGAAARPFITHHNALDLNLYLRISPETYLKRLLVGGLDRVYEINRNFRNEGIDTSHNPEFTMIEIYQAYADFTDMMNLIEEMVSQAAQELLGTTVVKFKDREIDVKAPWQRKTIHELIKEKLGVEHDDLKSLKEKLIKNGLEAEKVNDLSPDNLIKEVMDELIEPNLIEPIFVTHYPASLNPLCKRNKDNPSLSDRFEVIVSGFELANAFSELNDPIEQKIRFEEQLTHDSEEGYCNQIDEDYISALEVGLPPAGGMGIGIDRLVMLLTGQESIREVVLFPTLKPKSQVEVLSEMEKIIDEEEN